MYEIKEIPARDARELVKKYHYSGKVVANSKIHLGVFKGGELVGCLQFGYPTNGVKTLSKLSDNVNAMELNRMVMIDSEPKNSESMAISKCLKWIKKNTDIEWILSFSDGKQGNVGYIYQASNWRYLGYLLSNSFYQLDNTIMQNVS